MAPVNETTTLERDDTETTDPTDATTTTAETDATDTLLDELIAFTRDDRNDLAIRLLELNALHVEGEITDDEFAERRAELYAA